MHYHLSHHSATTVIFVPATSHTTAVRQGTPCPQKQVSLVAEHLSAIFPPLNLLPGCTLAIILRDFCSRPKVSHQNRVLLSRPATPYLEAAGAGRAVKQRSWHCRSFPATAGDSRLAAGITQYICPLYTREVNSREKEKWRTDVLRPTIAVSDLIGTINKKRPTRNRSPSNDSQCIAIYGGSSIFR